jgi:medium-chain acyl-[acyl-carrier-protein] hydrolase
MTNLMLPATPWLRMPQPNPQARLRLFCFPYAGGAASIYRTWPRYLPAGVEVCAVQLPGRENRLAERLFTDAVALAGALIPVLQPYFDKPFALFGHSMGSVIAYEVARQLYQQSGQTPTQLLVSGRRAPFLPDQEPPLHTLPGDDEFLAALQRRYQNLPALILHDAELRALFAPLLRADLTLVETYRCDDPSPLPCPLIALGGEADSRATLADLQAWRKLTHGEFALHLFPGGHFYLNEQTPALLAIIGRYLV